MSNYKVGDVAALFSNPKPKPTSECGKKLQSLFKEFHGKNKSAFQFEDSSAKETNKLGTKNEGNEDKRIVKKNKKRKFGSVDAESESNARNLKKFKPKFKNSEESDFPRKKKKASKFNYVHSDSFIEPKTNDSYENEFKSTLNNKPKGNLKSGFIKRSKRKIYDDSDNFGKSHSKSSKMETELDDSEDVSLREEIKEFMKSNSKKSKKKAISNANPEENPQEKFQPSFNLMNSSKDTNEVSDFIRRPKNKSKAVNSSFSNDDWKKSDKMSNNKTFDSDNDTLFKSEDEDYVKKKKFKKQIQNMNNSGKKSLKRPFVKREPDFAKLLDRNEDEDEAEKLKRTLFVGNLPLNTRLNDLKKLFSPFGEIEFIRFRGIETDKGKIFKKNASKSLNSNYASESAPAFVEFKERESAVNALTLSGTVFKGRHITVDFSLPAGSMKLYDSKRSIFIGNLPFAVTDESIWNAFSSCGSIVGVRVIRDKATGIGKGFGYVLFSTEESRENALSLGEFEIEGRSIRIKSVDSNKERQKKSNTSPVFKKDTFKSRAIKFKQKNKNPNSRKSITKLVKKEKLKHKKKKMASLLQKAMK